MTKPFSYRYGHSVFHMFCFGWHCVLVVIEEIFDDILEAKDDLFGEENETLAIIEQWSVRTWILRSHILIQEKRSLRTCWFWCRSYFCTLKVIFIISNALSKHILTCKKYITWTNFFVKTVCVRYTQLYTKVEQFIPNTFWKVK